MKKTTLNILSFFVIAVLLVFSFASCKSSKQCDSSYNNETRNDNLSAEYWVENAEIGLDFVTLDDRHNFYWDKDGNLVIVFDKYEVAPGSMGTPEFVINKDAVSDILKPEYR